MTKDLNWADATGSVRDAVARSAKLAPPALAVVDGTEYVGPVIDFELSELLGSSLSTVILKTRLGFREILGISSDTGWHHPLRGYLKRGEGSAVKEAL